MTALTIKMPTSVQDDMAYIMQMAPVLHNPVDMLGEAGNCTVPVTELYIAPC